ncbi:MAG: hypothetical protein QXX94_00950 [Candidatus Bathyarchaeia archaeon]
MNENGYLRAKRILWILKDHFPIPSLSDICRDPFKVLVRTIISQSTSETNTERAFNNLLNKIHVTLKNLAKAEIKDIEDALRIAGLHRNKQLFSRSSQKL